MSLWPDGSDRLRRLVERLNLRRFLRFLHEGRWDVIVNTHFLPAEMIAALRSKAELSTSHLTATTDFETHRLWLNQPCYDYFTGTEKGAVNLAHWGVPIADITVTGIPTHPAFSRPLHDGRITPAGTPSQAYSAPPRR